MFQLIKGAEVDEFETMRCLGLHLWRRAGLETASIGWLYQEHGDGWLVARYVAGLLFEQGIRVEEEGRGLSMASVLYYWLQG